MKKLIWYIVTFLAISVSGYTIVQYLIFGADKSGFVMTKIGLGEVLNQLWYVMLYIHAISSLVALVLGPFLLSRKFRNKNQTKHKQMGMVYYICILFGGLSGLYLAFEATGGIISTIGFAFLAIFWLVSAGMALYKIKHRLVYLHRKWMIRNYALSLAAVTLRLWLLIFVLIGGFENYETSYMIIAWLCWVPNLLIAEIYLKKLCI
nr:DUF2306 domain-containing protein [Lysinibacillus timonensis]